MPLSLQNAFHLQNRPAFAYVELDPQLSTNTLTVWAGSELDYAGFASMAWIYTCTGADVTVQHFAANRSDFSDEFSMSNAAVTASTPTSEATTGFRFHRLKIQSTVDGAPGTVSGAGYLLSVGQ